jgi:hypothetical protein
MSAIEKFKDRGYKMSVPKENQINFGDKDRGIIFFYLDKEKIGTSMYYTSDSKELNRIIKLFQKELGWENIQEINFW